MRRIESDTVEINNSSEKIYSFLSNLNNFEKLMPEQIINWKSAEDTCSFTIKGMSDISLKIAEKEPFSKIVLTPGDIKPMNFNLICLLNKCSENSSSVQIILCAELNAMMEMLAGKPLQNFVNMLVEKLKKLGNQL